MSKTYNDDNLLGPIRDGDENLYKQLYYLYKEPFKLFLMKLFRASEEDALEVYPISMAIMIDNIRLRKLVEPLTSSLKTYLFAIGRNQFHKRFFDKYKENTDLTEDLDALKNLVENPQLLDKFEHEELSKKIKQLLNKIGDPCKKLLILFYLKGYSIEAIMHEMGYSTEGAVRKKKFDCLKKLRDMLGD